MHDAGTEFSNPLIDLHRQAEAELQRWDSIEIVSTFGEVPAEYAAVHKSCALMDLPQRGVIELTGKDRLEFLNNLLTNQTWDKKTKSGIDVGKCVSSFLLNNKTGRLIAELTVIEQSDRTWLEMDARLVPPTLGLLEKYLFSEQVRLTSKLGAVHEIMLMGPDAQFVLNQCLTTPIDAIGDMLAVDISLLGHRFTVFREDQCASPCLHLLGDGLASRQVWMHLITLNSGSDSTGKRTVRPIGWAAFNACRIEAGRPIFGIDYDETALPAETGQLERAVSFTKGCYPGQEIVARMHSRGQLAKRLVGIRVEENALPLSGAPIQDSAGNTVGAVTSSTVSPVLSNACIALAVVKRPHFATGTKLLVAAEGAMRPCIVCDLAFWKESDR
jgi:folate-binding protein YgfZ